MNDANPLKQYFRQPALYMRLPTLGRWYDPSMVTTTQDHEIAVYGLTALDEIMLNTPDAMLNGKALEGVISNTAPDIKQANRITIPDLEALFLAIKVASAQGKHEFDRKCPKCDHENNFEINCQHLLDTMTYVEDSDTTINFNDELIVHVRPYDLAMRQMFLQREFEEQRMLQQVDESNKDLSEFERSRIMGESVERISKITFNLVSRSITKVVMIKQNIEVTDPEHLAEWLININKRQADAVIDKVNDLNGVGPLKKVPATCTGCGHEWEEAISFDPVGFFGQR